MSLNAPGSWNLKSSPNMPHFWNYEEKRKGTPSFLKEKEKDAHDLKRQLWFYFLKDGLKRPKKILLPFPSIFPSDLY